MLSLPSKAKVLLYVPWYLIGPLKPRNTEGVTTGKQSCGYQVITTVILFMAMVPLVMAANLPLSVERVSLSEGLSQSTVYSIAQDDEGFIWLATAEGINIFDGYELSHIRNDPQDPTSLSDNYARVILKDRSNTMWVGTLGGGLNRYNKEQQTFTHYTHTPGDPGSIPGNDVHCLFESEDGTIWIGTNRGVASLRPEAAVFESLAHDPASSNTISNGIVRAITQTSDGLLWFGTDKNGVSRYDRNTKTFIHFKNKQTLETSLSNNSINALLQDSSGRLWVGTEYGGLNLIDIATGRITRYQQQKSNPNTLNDSEVTSIYEDASGRLWLGTWSGGLNVFDPKTGNFHSYQTSLANPKSLSSNTIISLFEDHSGMLWAGSFDNGANRFSIHGNDFDHFVHDPILNNGPVNHMIWCFAEDKEGNIWVGSKKGLSKFSAESGKFESLGSYRDANKAVTTADVRALLVDGDWLWIGARDLGLSKLNLKTGESVTYLNAANKESLLTSNDVRLLLKDSAGLLWIGTTSGLNLLDPETGIIKQFHADATLLNLLPHHRIRALYEDSASNIWVGTSGGLSRYVPDTQDFVTVPYTAKEPVVDVNSIFQDSNGIFWLASSKGLVRYDPHTRTPTTFTTRQGLVNNYIYGIVPNKDYLWITTNNGLSRFNTQDFSFKNYKIGDGLQSNEFNFNAYLKAAGGDIYIGGVNGFNRFNPDHLGKNKTVPALSLMVKRFDKNDEPVVASSAINAPITVEHNDRRIEFHSTILHYLNPRGNRYIYKLEDYDLDWIEMSGSQRKVAYSGLPAGSYRFVVKGMGSNEEWYPLPVERSLRVKGSPWQSWWAMTAYFLVLAIAVAGLINWRTRLLKQRAQYLESQVQDRTLKVVEQNSDLEEQAKRLQELLTYKNDFYKRTSHELRTPLSLIRAPVEILLQAEGAKQKPSYLDIIKRNAIRLQRITDRMLQISNNNEVQRPGVQTIDLSACVLPIVTSFSIQAQHAGIQFTAKTCPQAAVTIEKDTLEDVLFNLLSNAVKYTQKGETVAVEIILDDDGLQVYVKDTGIGIPSADFDRIFELNYRHESVVRMHTEGDGIGLYSLKQQVVDCGGVIDIDSQEGKGTTVTVLLPCHWQQSEEALLPEPRVIVDTVGDKVREGKHDRILIIEDDADLQQVLVDLLADTYGIEVVATTEQGIQSVHNDLPDLIICDVMLPGRSGLELLEELKQDENLSYIPLVLLTALGDEESQKAGLERSADDYIVKPFSPIELKLRVGNQLAQRKRIQRWLRNQFVAHDKTDGFIAAPSVDLKKQTTVIINEKDQDYLQKLECETRKLIEEGCISQEELAAAMAQTVRTLQRRIRAMLNCSYTDYVQEVRIASAKQLLKAGCSVKAVAAQSGFNSPESFRVAFKKRVGMLPKEFQKKTIP